MARVSEQLLMHNSEQLEFHYRCQSCVSATRNYRHDYRFGDVEMLLPGDFVTFRHHSDEHAIYRRRHVNDGIGVVICVEHCDSTAWTKITVLWS